MRKREGDMRKGDRERETETVKWRGRKKV